MTRSFTYFIATLLVVAPLLGCGKDEDDLAQTFSCNEAQDLRCEKNAEYCLQPLDGEEDAEASCHALPADCTDCDCIEEDTPVLEGCSTAFVVCLSISTSTFRVECPIPEQTE